jgi:hypothetical protein
MDSSCHTTPASPLFAPHCHSSNKAPLTRFEIHAIISKADAHLSNLDAEITSLEAKLNEFKDERRRVQRHRDIHYAALSPMRRLPLEVISHIFILCLPEGWHRWLHRPHRAPLLLMQVDRHWRIAALRTPRLWTSLVLHLDELSSSESKERNQEHLEEMWAKRWFERSSGCGLSIRLISSANCKMATHPIIDVLVPHARRIEELSVSLSSGLYSALEPLRGCLSSLRDLSVLGLDEGPFQGFCSVFAVARALQSVSLLHCDHKLPTFKLPIAQLTHGQFNVLTIRQIHEILRQSRNLESLSVSVKLDVDSGPVAAIVSPLRSFTFWGSAPCLEWLCSPLTLPNLRDIRISAKGHIGVVWPSVMSLLDRSSCRSELESFALNRLTEIDEDALLEFLSTTPSLTALSIRSCSRGLLILGERLLRKLTCERGSGSVTQPLVPKLQSLSFDGFFAFYDRLANMIESRWRPRNKRSSRNKGSPEGSLRHVNLHLTVLAQGESLRRLEEMRKQGLDLKMTPRHKYV